MQTLLTGALAGGFAALGSAAAWAVGSILFRKIGDKAPPLGMNLGKGLIGLVYLAVALAIFGFEPMSGRTLLFLSLSGIAGIALGDTFFFKTLMLLEPRLTLLLSTVGQVFTVLLAMVILGERPTALAWLGMALIVGGVTWVMREQMSPEERSEVRQKRLAGLVWGLASAVSMSAGILLAKMAIEEVSALQATFVRLAAGVAGLLVVGATTRQISAWLSPFKDPRLLKDIVLAVVVIMFGGFYLSVLALKLADASVTSVLASTEPLFILPLAALVLHEKISMRAVLGSVVSTFGVALVLLSLS